MCSVERVPVQGVFVAIVLDGEPAVEGGLFVVGELRAQRSRGAVVAAE
ncbi:MULTISPECIES: hypothetical protein [Burkholderiaceae]|nr:MULTISPECIES: hypothetical protein [Burkholderiaceae]MBW0451055.1 hypothetical protein [Paraburkholderia phenoliruptrix]MBW9101910.1 hypothetical protein [Paraburkholderia phenoliruptrix]